MLIFILVFVGFFCTAAAVVLWGQRQQEDPIEKELEKLSIELAERRELERERIFKETGHLVPRMPRMTFTPK